MNTARDRAALVWGIVLIFGGVALLLETTGVLALTGAWLGTALLAAIGACFLALYLADRERWGLLIPAGVLFTSAVTSLPGLTGTWSGATFLFGLAATFGAVALVPPHEPERRWAAFVAVVLAIIGGFTLFAASAQFIWPAVLIALGAFLLYRSFGGRHGTRAG